MRWRLSTAVLLAIVVFTADDASSCVCAKKIGFEKTYAVTGQTYPRKIDSQLLDTLSGIAQSAHKAATDLRLLAHRKESTA